MSHGEQCLVTGGAGAFESVGLVCLLTSGLMFNPYDWRCRNVDTVNL